MKGLIRATTIALLASLFATMSAVAGAPPVAATTVIPRVALIVGPVGTLTPRYRALADQAARAAVAAGAEVVRAYSPNATWPAVVEATRGASIVVYLGHGNGWPSPYRDALFPATQNGFGLNPIAGVDDDAHQYFGEASVDGLSLARNAVVLLHHLCYASGNSEPGRAEGSQADAIQRVDNYAAGFLRAGAGAVVAEGHLGPAPYVRALLESSLSIEQIFAGSSSAHGNAIRFPSQRTPGFALTLDPDRPSGGYYRSLVSRGLTAGQVRAGAAGGTRPASVGAPPVPPVPSLAALGVRFGDPSLARTTPVVGASSRLLLPTAAGRSAIPTGVAIGVRWEPLLVEPATGRLPGPGWDAPEVALVEPEQPSTVVEPVGAKRWRAGLVTRVTFPAVPGLYRLVVSLHDASGVAYDRVTQELVRPVIIRVAERVAIAYGVTPTLAMAPAAEAMLPVRVVNAGSEPWERAIDHGLIRRIPARLVARWVSTTGDAVPDGTDTILDPDLTRPGRGTLVALPIKAPSGPGDFVLLLDVSSPELGPLSALGAEVAIVRVHVAYPGLAP